MLERLATFTTRRRRLVLVAALLLFIASVVLGGDVASKLSSGGFEDPAAESSRANDVLETVFGDGVPNLVLVVTSEAGNVDDPATVEAGLALTAEVEAIPELTDVASYWSLDNAPPLRSGAGDKALLLGRIEGSENEVDEVIAVLAPDFERDGEVIDVTVTGFAAVFHQVNETIEEDLLRAETIVLPITMILLMVIFRGLVAAALPLGIGALSVVGTFMVLELLNRVTEVSIFALNLTTALGLGLSIDYSLFVVSRFREELAAGHEPEVAISRTVMTAGRTVAFSAMTVAASLCALLIFPFAFLRSFAYAGVAVAGLAGLFSVVVLPAMLVALGRRVDSFSLRRSTPKPVDEGLWHRTAVVVMRRPIPIATSVILVLVFLGSPFLGIDLGLPDDRVLPESASSRAAADVIRDEFDSREAGALSIVAPDAGDPAGQTQAIDAYAMALSSVDGVARVDAYTGFYVGGTKVLDAVPFNIERFGRPEGTFFSVVPDVEPISAEGEALVRELRGVDAPFATLVTGESAQLVDAKSTMMSLLPWAGLIISAITFALLFLMFGSVVIPLKALALNVLSLSATFGAMVWIFQDGNLSGVLDFTATGSIAATTPILMFCVAFGLSMDYEVFLLSRIKEEYDTSGDNEQAVAVGLERTGRIVTAAALLIAVVFLAFATSRVSFIKLFGIGLALAVLVDAFLIRGTLVPAFMRLAGSSNWWAPAPMRRFHQRYGLREHIEIDVETDAEIPSTAPVPGTTTRDGESDEPDDGRPPSGPRPPGPSTGVPRRPPRTEPLLAPGRQRP